MKARFVLKGLKPLSVNSTYIRTFNGVRKSVDATEWFRTLCFTLSRPEHQAKLAELRQHFDPKLHTFKVCLTTVYPASELLTKVGVISSKTQDLSNTEKSIIDVFFLPKFNAQPVPEGVPNLNADDKNITHLESRKTKAPDGVSRGLIVEIEITLLSELPEAALD